MDMIYAGSRVEGSRVADGIHTGFGDGDSLLLHDLVDSHPVVL